MTFCLLWNTLDIFNNVLVTIFTYKMDKNWSKETIDLLSSKITMFIFAVYMSMYKGETSVLLRSCVHRGSVTVSDTDN